VRFWDTSALIPLFVSEPGSARTRRWIDEDSHVIVWALTRLELLAELARRRRERASPALAAARREALARAEEWTVVTALDVVRRHAERLVEIHPLRAGDAAQLAATLVAARGATASLPFVTFDDRQAAAVVVEGFPVLGAAD
jgi:hypothetical protein